MNDFSLLLFAFHFGSHTHSYRAIVLRALPNLKKLDNVEVTAEEVQDALRAPVPMQQSPQDVYEQEQQYNDRNTQQSQQQQQYRQQSPLREVSRSQIFWINIIFCISKINSIIQRTN
jgi:hypothetical protein